MARHRAAGVLALAVATILLVGVVLLGRASGAEAGAGGALVAQPVLPAAAGDVTELLGTSPQEAAGEVWGLSEVRGLGVVRYTEAGGWEEMPPVSDAEGRPIAELGRVGGGSAGGTTPAGGVAFAATEGFGGASSPQLLVLRDPGGGFRAAADPGAGPTPALLAGERLFRTTPSGVLLAPVEEPGGRTGAFVIPTPAAGAGAPNTAVLAYDGTGWQREPICVGMAPGPCEAPTGTAFRVLAIEASGPGDAWLLAKGAEAGEGIELFSRQAGSGQWRQRPLGGALGGLYGAASDQFPQSAPAAPLTVGVAARGAGQPLTVSATGVWVDATLTAGGESHDATVYYDIAAGEVSGSWCELPAAAAAMCEFPLGSELPAGDSRSLAWPGEGPGEPYGRRAITGVGEGAMLVLEGGSFVRVPLGGGEAGTTYGAALEPSYEGWLGSADGPLQVTRRPAPSGLASWPVPFRRPLLAIAPEPGAPVGSLGSEALAVGEDGEVARYLPGQGWTPESLLGGSGAAETPRLRAVAWPQPGLAYAVGDEGAMWLWRAADDLWEPDPGAPSVLIRGDFTGIAFDPSEPERGYAVGKQGLLLSYGRQWTPETLPGGVNPEANLTSIAFAGQEALATYKMPFRNASDFAEYEGGLLVNDGSGWRVEEGLAAALGEQGEGARGAAVPERVAGLPDGGAVVATQSGEVLERDAPGAPWQRVAGGAIGYPVALAAFREGGQLRAAVSVEQPIGIGTAERERRDDEEQVFRQPEPGQPPLLTAPYAPPEDGFLVRQTAVGWRDEERQSYPLPAATKGEEGYDEARTPDPILALSLSPDGTQGWAVGGVTGEGLAHPEIGEPIQTAGVMRYGVGAAPPTNQTSVPIAGEAGAATFAVGGDAACAGRCADLAGIGIGPQVWLPAAVAKAAGVEGMRAFLYTGQGVAPGLGASLGAQAFGAEEDAYAGRLLAGAGTLPVFAATAGSDLGGGSLAAFRSAFAGSEAPLGGSSPSPGTIPLSPTGPEQAYYSFESQGATGGAVRVVVLDYSQTTISPVQHCWLAQQLAEAGAARTPAIVVGNRDLSPALGAAAGDGAAVVATLLTGAAPGCPVTGTAGASAYFFDSPEEDRTGRLSAGGRSIPTFGSGTLGYVRPPFNDPHFLGASGFLLAAVATAQRDPATDIAPVTARLVPDVAQLALDATDGTLLRRSHVALFEALARRPEAGIECRSAFGPHECETVAPDPYVPIPDRCQGTICASGLLPEYRFSSSRPDIADFVAPDPTSSDPRAVLLRDGQTVPDPTSGLLCAYNAGTTTVTVETGGLAYSAPVTVQAGTVARPCGTVPLRNPPAPQPSLAAPPPPPPVPTAGPAFKSPSGTLPPPAPPAGAATPVTAPAHHPVPRPAPAPPASVPPIQSVFPVPAIVPPPAPSVARPAPPSGSSTVEVSSPVAQSAVAPEEEEEVGVATVEVHHASAYGGGGGRLPPTALVVVLLGAAIAATWVRDSRRPRPRPAYEGVYERPPSGSLPTSIPTKGGLR